MRRGLAVTLVVGALLTAACKDSSDKRAASAARARGGDSTVPGLDAGSGSIPGSTVAGQEGSSTTAGRRGSRTSTSQSAGTRGPATLAKPMEVGVRVHEGVNEVADMLGVDSLSTGDGRAQADAVIAEINGRGGILGRRIVAAFNPSRAGTGQTPEEDARQACTFFTETHPVEVVVSTLADPPALLTCLAKAKIAYINDNAPGIDDALAKQATAYVFVPSGFVLNRLARHYVDGLHAQGFFKDQRVGVYYAAGQGAVERVVQQVLLPRLRDRGVDVATTFAATGSNDAQAVLQLRMANVTRVVPFGISPMVLMNVAEIQQFRPAYAIYSALGLGALLQPSAPRAQLSGLRGIGWMPLRDGAGGSAPSHERCLETMKAAGQDTAPVQIAATMVWFCDAFYFLRDALVAAGDARASALGRGARALGSEFAPAVTFKTDFASGRPDGAAAYRDLRFDDACGCFRYFGSLHGAS